MNAFINVVHTLYKCICICTLNNGKDNKQGNNFLHIFFLLFGEFESKLENYLHRKRVHRLSHLTLFFYYFNGALLLRHKI